MKCRTPVPTAELAELERTHARPGWVGAWFAEAITQQALRPICQVSYVRQAWGGEVEGNPVIMTFDREMWGAAVAGLELPGSRTEGQPLFDGCVLEIKYAYRLPVAFEQ